MNKTVLDVKAVDQEGITSIQLILLQHITGPVIGIKELLVRRRNNIGMVGIITQVERLNNAHCIQVEQVNIFVIVSGKGNIVVGNDLNTVDQWNINKCVCFMCGTINNGNISRQGVGRDDLIMFITVNSVVDQVGFRRTPAKHTIGYEYIGCITVVDKLQVLPPHIAPPQHSSHIIMKHIFAGNRRCFQDFAVHCDKAYKA